MVSRTLCVSVLIISALLLSAGCTGTDGSTSPSGSVSSADSSDPAIGTWVQTGNTSLIITFAPEGIALLRFKMPESGTEPVYSDVSGTWERTGTDTVDVHYLAPLAGTEKTLVILFEDNNGGYVDSVLAADGTLLSDPAAAKEDKLHLARAGSGYGSGTMAVMAVSTVPGENVTVPVPSPAS